MEIGQLGQRLVHLYLYVTSRDCECNLHHAWSIISANGRKEQWLLNVIAALHPLSDKLDITRVVCTTKAGHNSLHAHYQIPYCVLAKIAIKQNKHIIQYCSFSGVDLLFFSVQPAIMFCLVECWFISMITKQKLHFDSAELSSIK